MSPNPTAWAVEMAISQLTQTIPRKFIVEQFVLPHLSVGRSGQYRKWLLYKNRHGINVAHST